MPLTAVAVQNAKAAEVSYRLNDGNSLYLEVRPSGVKTWLYRYKIAGKENTFTIGQFSPATAEHISVRDARLALDKARMLVKRGIHPVQHRNEQKLLAPTPPKHTFRALAEEWLLKNAPNRSERNTRQIRHVLMTDVYPAIGSLNMVDIKASQILEIAGTGIQRPFGGVPARKASSSAAIMSFRRSWSEMSVSANSGCYSIRCRDAICSRKRFATPA